jgi:hypothetical protein
MSILAGGAGGLAALLLGCGPCKPGRLAGTASFSHAAGGILSGILK